MGGMKRGMKRGMKQGMKQRAQPPEPFLYALVSPIRERFHMYIILYFSPDQYTQHWSDEVTQAVTRQH